ncbi:hypothetical protein [Vibrio sp. 10N.261.55.A7]|uniref:hypothetical protein n=1 Tax=Vibrio sp. 10N.261.55.A7 TaxID=1880851 RepID=UPI000C82A68A|nr:hypothetical protein [Vibrio sp. 10N.261.55.A7]PMJ98921.1 hypothetical protein BCU12_21400 [Vibrio sp. 10N.261.55.A7]
MNLTDIKLVPALVVNGQVIFHPKESYSERITVHQMSDFLKGHEIIKEKPPAEPNLVVVNSGVVATTYSI